MGPKAYTSSESVLNAQHDPLHPTNSQIGIKPAESDSNSQRSNSASPGSATHLDIANYPTVELLKMLAALLQHIATSNDQLHPMSSLRVQEQANESTLGADQKSQTHQSNLTLNDPRRSNVTTAALSTLNAPSSTLCFHAKHIPSISIEAYLLRILKYCPTTNDVFLSLLVYFDRMSRVGATGSFPDESLATGREKGRSSDDMEEDEEEVIFPGIRGFAIDSYNVHRLVIAGITVASKFFSDVFYTNARYAKVGGLAVHELNQLELHFLLLTDFRLTIPVSEIQQYGDQLLSYASDRSASNSVPRPLALEQSRAPARNNA